MTLDQELSNCLLIFQTSVVHDSLPVPLRRVKAPHAFEVIADESVRAWSIGISNGLVQRTEARNPARSTLLNSRDLDRSVLSLPS